MCSCLLNDDYYIFDTSYSGYGRDASVRATSGCLGLKRSDDQTFFEHDNRQ